MGLDGVEIVMAVEEAFDIQLEDAEAMKAETPRDLIDLVMSKVRGADAAGCLTQRAFNRLRTALQHQLPLKRKVISPQVRMADLVPKEQRKVFVKCLANELGTPPLPPLVRPAWLVNGLMIGCVVLGIAVAAGLFRHHLREYRGNLLLVAAVVAAGLGFLARALTQAFCVEFPPRIQTVGELARWIVAHKRDLGSAAPGKWTREQVAARIRDITSEQLGCADKYHEEASFVKDLGMG
jgi:acyl carrier protein